MKVTRFKNLMVALSATCVLATVNLASTSAQTTSTASPVANETVNVTEQMTTWIQVLQANGIDIPAGADGVVISNGAGGNITASLDAIVTQANTTVINAGNIAGGTNAINFVNGSGSGSVNNLATGVISSNSRAINIGGAVAVSNAGQVIGTGDQRNGTVYSDSVANNFSVTNAGTIDAGAGNQGAGVALEIGSRTTADIANSGTIQGRTNTPGVSSGSGLSGDGVRLANFGDAADRVFDGTITNQASGVISSESNSGTTAGLRVANTVGFQGKLDNQGLIEGQANGLYFGNPVNGLGGDHSGGVVNNSGRIESQSRALNIDGIGLEVNNSGSISGTGNQRNGTVYADSTAQGFTINNSGSIDAGAGNEGAGFSAELSTAGNNFTINNSGELRGRGVASAGLATAGDGIRLERTRVDGALEGSTTGLFTGTINNSGVVTSEGDSGTTAGFRAVNGVSFQGTLSNTGTISGVQNGVYFGNPVTAGGGDHTGGVVNNFGVISSDSRAFNLDGDGLQVNNSGDILATNAQRNGTFYVDGTADNFTINNSGSIDSTGGFGSGLSIQVGSFDGDVQNGTVFNSGTIIGNGESGVDAGVRLFTSTNGAEFNGDIINEVGGLISAVGSPAVLVEDGVLFDGSFINAGQIDGSVSLASGDLELLDSSILSLTIDSATDFDTVDIASDLLFGGTLELSFLDPLAFEIGQTFDLFDFETASGSFDNISSGPLSLDFSNLSTLGTVTVTGNSTTAVPEPSSFTVLALGGVVLLRRRRK